MSLWRIAWRSIQRRGLASTLTALSMALGVTLVVTVLLIHGLVERSFRNNSSLGYNVIVGFPGGSLQLVLNSVYYLSKPIENIRYDQYEEFLSIEESAAYRQEIRSDEPPLERDGRFHMLKKFAIPLCLGDYFGRFRLVGTTCQMFDDFEYDPEEHRKYAFSQGRNFKAYSEEHGYFECIVGSVVAREHKLKLGQKVSARHGDPEGDLHDEHPFTMVGILAPSGTPNDRAVFVNIEGFYLMDGHAEPIDEESESTSTPQETSTSITGTSENPDSNSAGVNPLSDVSLEYRPLPFRQRRVTAVLVRTVNALVTPRLESVIDEDPTMQAALPIGEIFSLFEVIVRPVQKVLLAITVLICIVSGVSILVSIYNSMSERRHEIAVMRALGASQTVVMQVVLWESVILSLGGGIIGWLAGHGLIGVLGPLIEERTGVLVSPFDLTPRLEIMIEILKVELGMPSEFVLIPGLIILAILVGFWPALTAYRTDVAKALNSSP